MIKKSRERNTLFTEIIYDIYLKVQQEIPVPDRYSSALHVSELSRKIIFGLFSLVASESLKYNYTDNIDDKFGNIINVLFQKFEMESLNGRGSLENAIDEYIHQLEEKVFFIPSIFFENEKFLDKKKYNLEHDEIGRNFGKLDTLAKIFIDVVKSLREEKIAFWKKFLEEYKKDKEGYDLEFRTKAKRFHKDLDRFSNITKEDLENTFKDLK